MENAVFTTVKPSIIDRIKGALWEYRFQRQANARRKRVAELAERVIEVRNTL